MNVDLFETSLHIRLDYEAMLAYLLLPPAGGVLLLVLEHKSDYVRYVSSSRWFATRRGMLMTKNRFHAWQSSLLFAFLFVIHLIFSWSSILSWLIFVADLILIAMLTFRAYVDGKVPLPTHDDALLTKRFIEEEDMDVNGYKAIEASFNHQHRGQVSRPFVIRPNQRYWLIYRPPYFSNTTRGL